MVMEEEEAAILADNASADNSADTTNNTETTNNTADHTDHTDATKAAAISSSAMKSGSRRKEDSAESSSTGSSEGKSGSGGGYSADCSASDQSSDENGRERRTELDRKVGSLKIHDDEEDERGGSSEDGDSSEQETATRLHKPESVHGANETPCQGQQMGEANVGFSMQATDAVYLDTIQKSTLEEECKSNFLLPDERVLPQWNGVTVAHPMDPRIDLSSVTVLQAGVVPVAFQKTDITQQQPMLLTEKKADEGAASPFSVENYSQLLEVGSNLMRFIVDAYEHARSMRLTLFLSLLLAGDSPLLSIPWYRMAPTTTVSA
jgi:hypothetical protein